MDDDTKETPNVKQMRETIERQNDELTELRTFRKDTVVADSGLHGPALKAVLKDIDRGDYKGPMSKDDIQEYARKEYDWEPVKDDEKDGKKDDESKLTEAEAAQKLIDEGTKELADLDSNSSPPPVKDLADQQHKAQVDGNFLDAAKLGVESQMDQLMGLSNK